MQEVLRAKVWVANKPGCLPNLPDDQAPKQLLGSCTLVLVFCLL